MTIFEHYHRLMNSIAKVIKKTTGLKIGEFCEQELFTEYKAFLKRVNESRLHPAEIFYIVYRTKKSIMELFGKQWNEIFIPAKNDELTKKVQDIFTKMPKSEKKEMESLLGFNDVRINRTQAPASNKIENITPTVRTPEKKSEEKSQKGEDSIGNFFVNIY